MILERRQIRGKWWVQLSAALLLLTAQCMAVVHATDHLSHDSTILCELFDAVENHDEVVNSDFANCLSLSFSDKYSQVLQELYYSLTDRHYLIRAPPTI